MIIGVDPGKTTGLAWWNEEDGQLTTAQQPAVSAVMTLWTWLEDHREESVEVACERFDVTPQTLRATRQYDALEVAGALRFKCAQLGVPYRQYARASAKRLAHDGQLQLLRLYRPGRVHCNDAVRQVVTHLATTRQRVFQQLVLDAQSRLG